MITRDTNHTVHTQPLSIRRGLLVVALLFLTVTVLPSAAWAQTKQERKAGLVAAEELGDWLETIEEEFRTLREQSEKLSDLRTRIVQAREDPAALSGENYAKLLVEITMLIPDGARLPAHIRNAVSILVKPIGMIIGMAVDFSLELARRNFRNQMRLLAGDTSMTESEKAWTAAKRAGSTRQVQLRLLLDWSLEKAKFRQ